MSDPRPPLNDRSRWRDRISVRASSSSYRSVCERRPRDGPVHPAVRGRDRRAHRPPRGRRLLERHGRTPPRRSAPWGSATATRSSRRRSASSPRPTASCTSAPSRASSTSRRTAWASTRTSSRPPSSGTDSRDPAGPRVRPPVPDRGCRSNRPAARVDLIEDACEGLGSSVDGRPLGSFGDVAVFAFYPNKQITTGEGGMVVTDDAAARRDDAQPAQPGPRRRRHMAPPRPPWLQLSARRDVGRDRRGPARAARRAARRPGAGRRRLRARARWRSTGSPSLGLRRARSSTGSSTSSGCTPRSTAMGSSMQLAESGCPVAAVLRAAPPPAVLPRRRSGSSRATSRSPSGSRRPRWPCPFSSQLTRRGRAYVAETLVDIVSVSDAVT